MCHDDVLEIETTTPFLKPGSFLTDEELEDNIDLALDMFQFSSGSKKILGKGAYGNVRLVKHKESGEYFALKIIEKSALANKNIDLMREVEIHK
jgi:hypothetical protein